jgi:hypothetical protein
MAVPCADKQRSYTQRVFQHMAGLAAWLVSHLIEGSTRLRIKISTSSW